MSEKNLVTLTNNSLAYLDEEKKAVDDLNAKILRCRKNALAKSLTESTLIRTDMIKKIKRWTDVIETRLFDPVVIKEMDINKVMSLMKLVTMFSVKIFAQVNQMESVLKAYMSTEQMVSNFQQTPHTETEEIEMKKKLTKAFVDIFSKTAETTVPVPPKQIPEAVEIIPEVIQKVTEDAEKVEADILEDIEKDTEDLLKGIDDFIKPDKL